MRLEHTFKGVGYGDYGVVWIEMSLGEESVKILREVIEDEVGHLLTDIRFHAHLTIFRGSELSDERKETIQAAVREVRLGSATIGEVTLRSRKTGKVMTEPLLTMRLADTTV